MGRNAAKKINYEVVKEDPPVATPNSHKPLLDNIEAMGKDGEWYRIASFESESGGYNRAGLLRQRPDMGDYEFKGGKFAKPLDDGSLSGLWCRYLPAVSGRKKGDELAARRSTDAPKASGRTRRG